MAINRLVGSDAELEKCTLGTPLVTGSAVKGSWYKIVAIDGTTVFPAGYEVGDLIQGQASMTFSTTNSASLATFTLVQDCSSFSFEVAADEIEVTVLADDIKKYRSGKKDFSGTIEGITFISVIKTAGSILNRFLRVVTGDTAGNAAAVLNIVDGSDYYIRALLQDDETVGETLVFLFGQVELFNYNLGASVGDAQTWSSGVRMIGADPIVYVMDCETPTT